MMSKQSCGVILRDADGRFLFVKSNKSNKWGFPKGCPEGDELPYQTAERETLEETGLVVYLQYAPYHVNRFGQTYFLMDSSRVFQLNPTDDEGTSDIKFCTFDEIKKEPVNAALRMFSTSFVYQTYSLWAKNIEGFTGLHSAIMALPNLFRQFYENL